MSAEVEDKRLAKAMQVTRACDYAFRALAYLARHGTQSVETARIAREVEVPPIYLRKIFQGLSRAGLVRTSPGTHGGVSLARTPDKISLKDIIEAVEGPIAISECIANPETCKRAPACKVRSNLATIQEGLSRELGSRRLSELS